MMTTCEICGEEYKEEFFQNHIFECHGLLFSQYIGLISKKISFRDKLIEKVVKQKKKKVKKNEGCVQKRNKQRQ